MEHIKAITDSLKIIIKRIEFLENKLDNVIDSSREAYGSLRRVTITHGQRLEKMREVLMELKHQQTILRSKTDVELVEMIQTTYEKLKELTRSQKISKDEIRDFISKQDITQEIKEKLLSLSPHTYI